ncbi:MAG TPA: signal peptidase I [Pyrinomonadaceae bacterium]|jgi:signal peptidase I
MSEDRTSTGLAEPPAETETKATTSGKASRAASRNGSAGSAATERKTQGPPKSVWREYFESAVVTVIMALFGMTFIVQAVKVPTGSMQNTINIGDHLLVNKFIFAAGPPLPFLPQRQIRRGDIIVFKYPGNNYEPWRDQERENNTTPYKTNYVKRVIGLPGDRIEIRGTRVIVNGQPLPERIVIADDACQGAPPKAACHDAPLKMVDDSATVAGTSYTVFYNSGAHDPEEQFPAFKHEAKGPILTVPADSYFVMGDNRDNSEDSRWWGFVRRDLIIGRAMFVYWSYDESASKDGNPLSLFFQNTRWKRTGTMVK